MEDGLLWQPILWPSSRCIVTDELIAALCGLCSRRLWSEQARWWLEQNLPPHAQPNPAGETQQLFPYADKGINTRWLGPFDGANKSELSVEYLDENHRSAHQEGPDRLFKCFIGSWWRQGSSFDRRAAMAYRSQEVKSKWWSRSNLIGTFLWKPSWWPSVPRLRVLNQGSSLNVIQMTFSALFSMCEDYWLGCPAATSSLKASERCHQKLDEHPWLLFFSRSQLALRVLKLSRG